MTVAAKIRQRLRRARKVLDKDLHNVLVRIPETPCASCTKAYCCSGFVLTYQEEVLDILGALSRHWSPERRAELVQRLLDWLAAYRKASPEARLDDQEWFRLKVPCPFLEEGRCSIYDIRPGTCRTHYVRDQDPEVCKDPDSTDVMLNVLGAYSRYSAHVLDGKAPPIYAPFPLMILKTLGLGQIGEDEYLAYFLYTMARMKSGHRNWRHLP